jgi:RNA polymerase sigma-70 factor (ECF subfamily)
MADVGTDRGIDTIVQSCQQGDLSAFATLFTRFQDRVYDLACSILNDEAEAEDAVQDTFLRAFEAMADFRGESSFETWLVAIAVNRCRDRLRRRKARRTLPLESLAPRWLARVLGLGRNPEAVLEWREGRASLWAMVDRLNDRLRLPLILRYHYGLRCDEVAPRPGTDHWHRLWAAE